MVPGLNSGGGEIFRTCANRPWVPPSHLENGYRLSFPRVKRPGRGVFHPPPCRLEVQKRRATLLVPLWVFRVRSRVNFTFIRQVNKTNRTATSYTERYRWMTRPTFCPGWLDFMSTSEHRFFCLMFSCSFLVPPDICLDTFWYYTTTSFFYALPISFFSCTSIYF
jgi:hypothetical protein